MIIAFFELIQQSNLAQILRSSIWLYPFINFAHIIGMILFFGSLIPLDLRVLGFGQWQVELKQLDQILKPLVKLGLILVLLSGSLLFLTRPLDYINAEIFLLKIIFILIALGNGFLFTISRNWQLALIHNKCDRKLKAMALFSIVLWTCVVLCGRLVGYR